MCVQVSAQTHVASVLFSKFSQQFIRGNLIAVTNGKTSILKQ